MKLIDHIHLITKIVQDIFEIIYLLHVKFMFSKIVYALSYINFLIQVLLVGDVLSCTSEYLSIN